MDDVHPDRSNTHNRDLNQTLTHISYHMQAGTINAYTVVARAAESCGKWGTTRSFSPA